MASHDDHLSQIETLWSVVERAHAGDGTRLKSAQVELLERYSVAVRRYALAALRSEELADEVQQEFALRFVRGDFGGADPTRGRFRSFVKTAVYHLIIDQQRKQQRNARQGQFHTDSPEPAAPSEEDRDAEFDRGWRDTLLNRAWERLRSDSQISQRHYYTALRLRVDHPELRSPELAALLAEQTGKPVNGGAMRVLLHRAREAFGAALLDEVRQTLRGEEPEALEEELIALGLLEYCRPLLDRSE